MQKMLRKVFIISYNNWWEKRLCAYYQWFASNNFDVCYVTSDFNHFTKDLIDKNKLPKETSLVHVPRYRRNISIKRVFSHIVFTSKVIIKLIKEKPDVVIGSMPCNSLGFSLWIYRKIYKDKCIISDITDMWPESFPVISIKNKLRLLMGIWRWPRTLGINSSDFTSCECKIFADELNKYSKSKKYVFYLYSDEYDENDYLEVVKIKNKKLKIIYLGSINNIIDIEKIEEVLVAIRKKREIEFHIIGGGATCFEFVNRMKKANIYVILHGMVFDRKKRISILRNCHFGINIMKPSVFVGLTTKSIDYTAMGIPLINAIRGDTQEMIERYNAGFDVINHSSVDVANKIENISDECYIKMRRGARQMFLENFSDHAVRNKINKYLRVELKNI